MNRRTLTDIVAAGRRVDSRPGTDSPVQGTPAVTARPDMPGYTPFPVEVLPEPIRQLVVSAAAAIGCDAAFVALPALATAAAAIGATRVISPKGGWDEPAAVWAMTIGRSGAGKSPGLGVVQRAVTTIDDDLEEEYAAALITHEQRVERWNEEKRAHSDPGPRPRPPARSRFSVQDVTIEALIGTLQDNPRGVLVLRDELAGWLGSFRRYKSGEATDLPNWLSLFRREPVSYTRKTGERRDVRIPGVCVSVIGTIQPGVLKRLLTRETRESGLLARLLLAMPPEVPRQWTEAEVEESLVNQFEDSLRGLRRLGFNADQRGRNRPHRVTLSAEAKGVFVAFFNRNGMRTFEVTEDEAAARSKMEAYALRFALLFHCVRYVGAVEHPDVVGAADMAAAVRLTEWFIAETARVYQMLGETEVEEADRKLVDVVRRLAAKTPSGLVSSRDIQRSNPQKYPNAQAAEATLDRVVQLGLGEWEGVPSGLRGRPPSRAVRIIQQQPDTTT